MPFRPVFVACALGLALLSSTPATATETRILVAVGANSGLADEAPLRYAVRDADRVAAVLKRTGGVSADHVIVVRNATPGAVERAIGRARSLATGRSDVTLFFYYSGHGSADDLHLGGQRLPLARVHRLLEGVPASLRIAVIDACRGRGTQDKGLKPGRGFSLKLAAPAGPKGAVTLRSSSDGEASQESEALQGAVFTHYLLTALRGGADLDRDHRVTLDEAWAYAYRQTVRRSARGPGNVMHPSAEVDLKGAGSVVITRTRRASATLVLPADADVQYLVFARPSGAVVAEVWAEADRPTRLALAPGRYLLHRRGPGGGAAVEMTLAKNNVETAAGFHAVPVALLTEKGGHLRLWRHELRAGYGAGVTDVVSFAHHVRLRYGVGTWRWGLSLGVDLGQTQFETTNHDQTHRWVGGDLRAELPRLLGPVDLSAGVAWRVVHQVLDRRDAATLVGSPYATSESHTAGAAGPTLALGWRIDLTPRWYLYVDAEATGLFRGEGDELAFRLEGALGLAAGVSL